MHVLEDASQRLVGQQAIKPGVKYDRTGKVPIILVPQPSDDPNDPLVRTHALGLICEETRLMGDNQ